MPESLSLAMSDNTMHAALNESTKKETSGRKFYVLVATTVIALVVLFSVVLTRDDDVHLHVVVNAGTDDDGGDDSSLDVQMNLADIAYATDCAQGMLANNIFPAVVVGDDVALYFSYGGVGHLCGHSLSTHESYGPTAVTFKGGASNNFYTYLELDVSEADGLPDGLPHLLRRVVNIPSAGGIEEGHNVDGPFENHISVDDGIHSIVGLMFLQPDGVIEDLPFPYTFDEQDQVGFNVTAFLLETGLPTASSGGYYFSRFANVIDAEQCVTLMAGTGIIIPEVVSVFQPSFTLTVYWDYLGNDKLNYQCSSNIPRAQVSNHPHFSFDDGETETFYYTMILTDPTVPDPVDRSASPAIHWRVMNIPSGGDWTVGDVIDFYYPPNHPAHFTAVGGTHPLTFLFYKQPCRFGYDTDCAPEQLPEPLGATAAAREFFNLPGFVEEYGLTGPVTGFFFGITQGDDADMTPP